MELKIPHDGAINPRITAAKFYEKRQGLRNEFEYPEGRSLGRNDMQEHEDFSKDRDPSSARSANSNSMSIKSRLQFKSY